jgi:hypothetical protein
MILTFLQIPSISPTLRKPKNSYIIQYNTIQLLTKQNNEFAYIFEIRSVTFPTALKILLAILRCSETVSEKTPTVFLPQTKNLSFLVFSPAILGFASCCCQKKILHLSFSTTLFGFCFLSQATSGGRN